jgi:phosphate-selective porin OprO/OprP
MEHEYLAWQLRTLCVPSVCPGELSPLRVSENEGTFEMRSPQAAVAITAAVALAAMLSPSRANAQYMMAGSQPNVPISQASYADLMERMDALEAAIQADDEQSDGPCKEVDITTKPTLKINGRIHLDYWNFTNDSPGIGFFEHPDPDEENYGADPEDRMFFRRIRLKFEGDVFENALYRMQIDFNTPDSGEIKDVYIGFKELPLLGTVLFGNQKRPLGLDHLNSSRFNIFIERPLVVEAFNEDARRLGIAAYNYSADEVYHWRYGVYALENMSRDGKIVGDSMQLSGNARLSSSPWYDETSGGRGYFHWAISGMVAKPDGDAFASDTNSNEGRFRTRAELRSDSRWINTGRIPGADWYEILGLEAILNCGPLQVVGEYQSNWMQRDNVTAGTGPDLHFHGGYVYLAYMLTGEHVPYKRRSGTIDRVRPFENFFVVNTRGGSVGGGLGAWQVALRYSYLDLTDNDIYGGVENNVTLGVVWYFNAYSSLQFNAIYGDIQNREAVEGYTDGYFTALGTRLRINF